MKIALAVEYLGTHYCGWQRQLHSTSVQAHVESALSVIANHTVKVFCAGRTDTGVHALAQIIHFETDQERPLKAWVLGGNSQLPDDISILWAKQVDDDFHARFSAVSRRYRYVIDNRFCRPAILSARVTWVRDALDDVKMNEAAQNLLGEKNFKSFQASSCQSPTSHRHVTSVSVRRVSQLVIIEITANAFLHHMVRNIVGSLIEVGRGNKKPNWIQWLIDQENRCVAAPTAAPDGLYFVSAKYPNHFHLPKTNSAFFVE